MTIVSTGPAPRHLIHRMLSILLAVGVLVLSFPRTATANPGAAPQSAVTVHFRVIAVQKDTSVTIRTQDFPVRTSFTVTMDAIRTTVGAKPANTAVAVGTLDSSKGGELEATFPIPESLRGTIILSIRIESKDGYTANAWFFNEDLAAPLTSANQQPGLSFDRVQKGISVHVQAMNLPPNTTFWVRLGPYYSFYRDYRSLPPVLTAADGSVNFDVSVPENIKDADYLMLRMDGGGQYVYGIYQNVTGGAAVAEKSLYKFQWCSVVSMRRIPALHPGDSFDAVWTVQNTSRTTFKGDKIAYKLIGGEAMQKYKDFYALGDDIPDGRTFDVAVDMIAPQEVGWHTARWAIFDPRSNTVMCEMKVTVPVTHAP